MVLPQTEFNAIRDRWSNKPNVTEVSIETLTTEWGEAINDIGILVEHSESLRAKFIELQSFVFNYAAGNQVAKIVYDKIGAILNK